MLPCSRGLTLLAVLVAASPAAAQTTLPPGATFAQLFAVYRAGNADAAVEAFSLWKPARVKAEAKLPDGVDDIRSLAALALFHTEAGMRNRTYGDFAEDAPNVITLGGWGIEKVFEPHIYAAYRLVDGLIKRGKREKNPVLLSFCKNWYILTMSHCRRWGRSGCLIELDEKGEHDLDGENDPEYLLLIGSLREPVRQGVPVFSPTSAPRDQATGGMTGALPALPPPGPVWGQQARWAFWKALELAPTLVEARLRLGRVHFNTGDRQFAEEELRRTIDEARQHAFASHLAPLFLGALLEFDDQLAEAIPFYRQAVIVIPRAHTARVALGQSLVRSAAHDEGWSMTRAMFNGEGPNLEPALDPSIIYFAAQYWQGASRVKAMRDLVRR